MYYQVAAKCFSDLFYPLDTNCSHIAHQMTKIIIITKPIRDGTTQQRIDNLNFESAIRFDSA